MIRCPDCWKWVEGSRAELEAHRLERHPEKVREERAA